MAHQDETEIVKASRSRLREVFSGVVHHPQIKVSGIVMDAYQFLDDSKPFKAGHIFHANKLERIQFGLRSSKNNLEESTGKVRARFLVSENEQLSTMENVMKLGFKLKHIGILKPIFVAQKPQVVYQNPQVGAQNPQVGAQNQNLPQVGAQNPQVGAQNQNPPQVGAQNPHVGAQIQNPQVGAQYQNPQVGVQNPQLPKVVLGFGWFDISFSDWLAKQTALTGTFLYESEKQMLRTAYGAIDEMWRSGYTCDSLADPASYVIIGASIKILPHLCRLRDYQNDTEFYRLRNDLADLLDRHIKKLWIVPGLEDFILLLKNQNARTIEDICGHPILLKPDRRQLLYRGLTPRRMSKNKLQELNQKIKFSPLWEIELPHKDEVLESIIRTNGPFKRTAEGALIFADMVSRHYVQHLKARKEDWYKEFKDDTVDDSLAKSVPGLLSKRYCLSFDNDFIAA